MSLEVPLKSYLRGGGARTYTKIIWEIWIATLRGTHTTILWGTKKETNRKIRKEIL